MSTQPEGAGREAGGSLLPVPAPLAAKLRAAGRVAPAWYAAAVVALGAIAAVALVGVPAGLGLALLGVALCGLAAAHGTVPGAYTLTLWALAAALAAVPALRDADWVWIPSLVAAGMLASLADRKSTRLNSSHRCISYAVFCLKKKNNSHQVIRHNKHNYVIGIDQI